MGRFLLWVRSFDGTLLPQLAFDEEGGKPYIDSGIRSAVASWTPLAGTENALSLDELAHRHPPQMGRMLSSNEVEDEV